MSLPLLSPPIARVGTALVCIQSPSLAGGRSGLRGWAPPRTPRRISGRRDERRGGPRGSWVVVVAVAAVAEVVAGMEVQWWLIRGEG